MMSPFSPLAASLTSPLTRPCAAARLPEWHWEEMMIFGRCLSFSEKKSQPSDSGRQAGRYHPHFTDGEIEASEDNVTALIVLVPNVSPL